MMLFRVFLVINVLVCLLISGFFLAGLGDGTVGPDNIALWVPLVGVPAAILIFGMQVKRKGRTGAATALLAAIAIPGLLGGGFVVLMFVMFTLNPGSFR